MRWIAAYASAADVRSRCPSTGAGFPSADASRGAAVWRRDSTSMPIS